MKFTITDSDGFASTQDGTHIDFIDDELLVIKDGQNIVSAHRDWTRVTSTNDQITIASTLSATIGDAIRHLDSDDIQLQNMEVEAMEAGVASAKADTVAIIHAEIRKLLDDGVNQLNWYDSHIRVLQALDVYAIPSDIASRLEVIDDVWRRASQGQAPAPRQASAAELAAMFVAPPPAPEPPRMPEQPAEHQCDPMPDIEPACPDCGAGISRCTCESPEQSDLPAEVPQKDLRKKRILI